MATQLRARQFSSCGLLFFCSAEFDLEALAAAFNSTFAGLTIAGCTTAGELTVNGYEQGSLCVVAFSDPDFHLLAAGLTDLHHFDLAQGQRLVNHLLRRGREDPHRVSDDNVFALTLLDGLSSQEETVLVALQSALGKIPHFGGSAGDDNQLRRTHVFFDGAFHTDAAVVVLVRTRLDFEVFSTQHVSPLGDKLVVTEADPPTRTVFELDAEPAAEAYAKSLGMQANELDASVFALHPLAVKVGQEYYIRSIQRVNDDLSLTFYCAVGNGAVLTRMQPQPMLPDLERCLSNIEGRIGTPQLTIACDCVLRRLESMERGEYEAASAWLQRHRVVGFTTYGEHIQGIHVNQTFTGVVLSQHRARVDYD
ncbi:MAG: FIST C-terminal domain-containing protein [Idiomarina sp.]|nr:FIST C-terminal domain-containing protein [Idiomarina sp.]